MEVIGRAKQDARAESNAGAVTEDARAENIARMPTGM